MSPYYEVILLQTHPIEISPYYKVIIFKITNYNKVECILTLGGVASCVAPFCVLGFKSMAATSNFTHFATLKNASRLSNWCLYLRWGVQKNCQISWESERQLGTVMYVCDCVPRCVCVCTKSANVPTFALAFLLSRRTVSVIIMVIRQLVLWTIGPVETWVSWSCVRIKDRAWRGDDGGQ